MTGWKNDISRELQRAREARNAGNEGMARTCARRAVGIAATHLQREDVSYTLGRDFISQLRAIVQDGRFSEDVRGAARRLQERIRADFSSPSTDPVNDAETILADLISRIERDQNRSSER